MIHSIVLRILGPLYQKAKRLKRQLWKSLFKPKERFRPFRLDEEAYACGGDFYRENRILIIDWKVPTYDKDSGSYRMFQLLTIFRELDFDITFLPDDRKAVEPYTRELRALGIEVLPEGINIEGFFEKSGASYRFVLLSRPEPMTKYISLVRAHAVNARVIYDTVDLHWIRFSRAGNVTGNPDFLKRAENFKAMELFNASCSDLVITVTKEERDILLREDPTWNVAVIPNIHDVQDAQTPLERRKGCLFIGGFHHQPNEDAALFFIYDIMSLIKRQIKDLQLFIVGSNPSPALLALSSEDIIVTGYIKDVDPYFETARVFVSPLRYGAGMKGKIGQSMAYGLPVVATTVSAEGIGLVDGETALIADDAESFASAVMRLYTDDVLWRRLSENSSRFIDRNFSKRRIKEQVASIFEQFDVVV